MDLLSHSMWPVALAFAAFLAGSAAAPAADDARTPCTDDAMIVFDASGSMAGNTVQGLFSDVTRIDEVRKALAQVLPSATKFRKVGLITYGPGPYAHCNVELDFTPMPNAAERIMSVVNAMNPAGKTPLVEAVKRAAEVLAYQGTIVLLTDGEETCGGAPCELGKAIKATATGDSPFMSSAISSGVSVGRARRASSTRNVSPSKPAASISRRIIGRTWSRRSRRRLAAP